MRIVFLALVLMASVSCGEGSSSLIAPTPVVAPTPPASLPPLSDEARKLIIEYNINYWGGGNGTIRWTQMPITVWADANFAQEDLQAAVDFWNRETNGKISMKVVDTLEEASLTLSSEWLSSDPVGICGNGGPRTFRGNIVMSGSAKLAFMAIPSCRKYMREAIAHEIGHAAIPIGGHTPLGDIMSVTVGAPPQMRMSALLLEYINWLYTVPPGTRLE